MSPPDAALTAAGLARLPATRFLAFDAVAVLLWAIAYTSAGRIFASQVGAVVVWLEGYLRWVLAIAVLLIVSAAGWRVIRFPVQRGSADVTTLTAVGVALSQRPRDSLARTLMPSKCSQLLQSIGRSAGFDPSARAC